MRRVTVALWGCGRVGRATGELLAGAGYPLEWFCDASSSKSAWLAEHLGTGQVLHTRPEPPHHPEVDVIIDASGDRGLLPYWRETLRSGRARYVFLTRREPAADAQIMMGMPGEPQVAQEGKVTAMGSCTGNAFVPLVSHIAHDFPVDVVSVRVLHPLKQHEIFELRSIETALERSVADCNPELAAICSAESMELPVERGMALDVALTFAREVRREELRAWFASLEERYPFFVLSTVPETSSTITGNTASAVIDGGWRILDNHLRMLLWQDNELGVSARIFDLLETIQCQMTTPQS